MVPSLYGLVASDSQYGQIANGPGPQIAVGRLPATNALEVTALINKIKAYEAAPPSPPTAVLLADLADPAVGNFPQDMGAVQAALCGSYTVAAILPAGATSNTMMMRNLLLTNLDAGADLFCYYGHGASQQLGNSGYLTSSDVPALTNTNGPPLMSAITCLSGFFAEPGYDCLAETLVLSPQAGAIATLSASGFSLDAEATSLNQGLMTALVSGTPGRLGDFVRRAMANYNQTPHFTPSAMYNLLGDPALLYRAATAPSLLPPQITSLNQNGNGTFALTFSAQSGQLYTLTATTNLALPPAAWPVISTGAVPFGPFVFTDLAATNFSQRFYRLVTQLP
jgi:hypothetical protein